MKPSGECSSFPFFIIQHYLSPSKSLTPFTASLTASLSFARIGQSPRRRAVFLHQAVLESLHHTVCLLASGSGDDDYEVTGQGCGPQALTLGNLLRFDRGRFARKPTYYLELWPWQDLHTQDLHTSLLPLTDFNWNATLKKKNKKEQT